MPTATSRGRKKVTAGRVGTWSGGYIRRDSTGVLAYYIDKKLGGRRFTVSTRCDRQDAAEVHYARFCLDPEAYTPTPVGLAAAEEPLVLDADLAERFLKYSRAKGNTEEWIACQSQQLAWWAGHWGDTNLRVSGGDEEKRRWLKEHVQKPLEGTKGQQQRVAVLSTFFAWLRKVALELSPSSDPTFGMLARPAPYKPSSTKEAITEARFREIREQLPEGVHRWAFDVLIATGRHAREIRVFAASGPEALEPLPEGRPLAKEGAPLPAAVLAFPSTKAGVPAWIAVSAEVQESARRLLEHGAIPPGAGGKGWEHAIHDACEAADAKAGRVPEKYLDADGKLRPEMRDEAREKGKVRLFHPGWARRSVRTYAGNKGASGPECDDFLGHAKRTGERHYGRHVPLKVPTMI